MSCIICSCHVRNNTADIDVACDRFIQILLKGTCKEPGAESLG